MTSGLGQAVLAHGVRGRTDLPLATPLAVTGALWAVAASFVAVTVMWPSVRSDGHRAGRPLPVSLQGVVDSQRLRNTLRVAVLAGALPVTAVGLAGPTSTALNLAPYAVYITFWVGLVLVSLLLGPVWRVVNPLRFIHRGLSRLLRRPPEAGALPLPSQLGWWPTSSPPRRTAPAGSTGATASRRTPRWSARSARWVAAPTAGWSPATRSTEPPRCVPSRACSRWCWC